MTAETIEWVAPDGTRTTLVDLRGITGRMMPPIDLSTYVVPGSAGSRIRQVRHGAGQVVIPVLIDAATPIEYRQKLRTMATLLDPVVGDGVLAVDAIDGTQRELTCRCTGGFGGNENYPDFGLPSLLFYAADPYWYDTVDTTDTFTTGTAATFFPFFPLRLSSSEVFASVEVDNSGDVEASPVWTWNGPGDLLTLRNLTTGETLSIDYTLSVGESVTIDSRRDHKTVTLNDGTNLFGELANDSILWALSKGSNSIQIEMTGGTVDSSVTVRYRQGYLSA